MANAEAVDGEHESLAGPKEAPRGGRRKKKLLIVGAILVLALGAMGAALSTGMLGNIGGLLHHSPPAPEAGGVDLPDIVANLRTNTRRPAFVRLKARLEIADKADEPVVTAAMPRVLDMFQTYLRDMRPEELRGSAGTYRLREELIARANIALAPARITEILFVEMLVQ